LIPLGWKQIRPKSLWVEDQWFPLQSFGAMVHSSIEACRRWSASPSAFRPLVVLQPTNSGSSGGLFYF
jgi:hypothetical protein